MAMSSPSLILRVALFRQILSSSITGCHFLSSTPTIASQNPCLLGGEDASGDGDGKGKSFYVVRDDLLHPLINGNKARKLDALLPLLEQHGITDVVTCGGCQSAHTAAVGVTCAERGLNSHLLLRGEQPEILTGYNLISDIYGNITYVPRSLYALREDMLKKHAKVLVREYGSLVFLSDLIEPNSEAEPLQNFNVVPIKPLMCSEDIHKKVVIVNEGAGDGVALLGVIRLVNYLSGTNLFGTKKPMKLVVDAGTGTTAVGLALGTICFGLPWEVTAIMLADSMDGYHFDDDFSDLNYDDVSISLIEDEEIEDEDMLATDS
ncbi:unnamed protein product [Rhodiola kirilowii]